MQGFLTFASGVPYSLVSSVATHHVQDNMPPKKVFFIIYLFLKLRMPHKEESKIFQLAESRASTGCFT